MMKYELLYNAEQKVRFIEKYEMDSSRNTLYAQLARISEKEFALNKDISEMNQDEIKETLLSCQFSSVSSAISHINTYKRYSETQTSTSPFYVFDNTEMAKNVIAKNRDKRYSKEEIELFMGSLVNDNDKALILCLFEGIKGQEYSEIFNIKVEDIGEEEVNGMFSLVLNDSVRQSERSVLISKHLKELLIRTNKQLEYMSPEGLRNSLFNESEFVFKKVRKGKQKESDVLDANYLNRKMLLFKKVFDNDYLKAEDITRSGMMHMANEIYKNKGVFTREDINLIGEQFGIPKVALNNTEIKGFNITTLKRKIFHSTMSILYPEFKYFE